MINDEADKVFDSLKNKYQNNLELMKRNDFVINYAQLLYYEHHEIIPNHGGSCIGSPAWIKNKRLTINLINKKYNKWFQYAVTVVLNHKERKKHLQRRTKIKHFVNNYN